MQDTTTIHDFIGIDVSKKTLDICHQSGSNSEHLQIGNSVKAIAKYFRQFEPSTTIIAMENTGRYNWALYEVLANTSFTVYVLNPLHLVRSLGLVRGKNDKVDALRIVQFVRKNHQDLRPWVYEGDVLRELKLLLSERRQLVEDLKRIKIRKKEEQAWSQLKSYYKKAQARDGRRMKAIQLDMAEVEHQITELISRDAELSQLSMRVQSVPGVGKVLCWNLIAKTNGFKTINNPRKLACFAGVAPFDIRSGTTLALRPRVSDLADKHLKHLLHMAAMSASLSDPELIAYFKRKVAAGSSKMSVLNAIRNKIVHRVCAVVRDEKIFEKRLVNP